MTVATVPLLDIVPRDAPFPTERLAGLDSALVLFAAAWLGKQDAVFAADQGLRGTCVDVDQEQLDRMQQIYPDGWEFRQADAFAFTRTWRAAGRRWDAVTVDCPTNLFERCATELELFCDVARRLVVLGTGRRTELVAPDGWKLSERLPRSSFRGGVQWAILERSWS